MSTSPHPFPLPNFEPTRWSLVLRARVDDASQRQRALEELCQAYWYPLYAFLRRSGRSVEDAQDLVQEFFVRLLSGQLLDTADPEKGKFRTLLLAALKQVDADAWRAATSQKRGGGARLVSIDSAEAEERFLVDVSPDSSAELMFDRAWAAALMERTWERLRLSYATPDLAAVFAELAPRISGSGGSGTLAEAGARLGMSEGAVKTAVSRLRQRFGAALRSEVAETASSPEAARQELSHLLTLFP